jgi:hypothetical protein
MHGKYQNTIISIYKQSSLETWAASELIKKKAQLNVLASKTLYPEFGFHDLFAPFLSRINPS